MEVQSSQGLKRSGTEADTALGTGSAESHGDPDVGGGEAGLQGVPASRGPSDLSDQKGLCWVGVGGTWKSLRREQHS